jgi:hypothetical protein
MRSSVLIFALMAAMHAQTLNRKVDLPADSPVTLVSDDWGDTGATARGGAFFVDVHASLSLRNASQKRVHGITLSVSTQEVTPGGKGSVSVPSLDAGPGEVFPVRIDLKLLRPIGSNAAVEVKLDGVLFDDLSFYGADALHSRRTMTVWELEARRDRLYFKKLLETAGRDGLQKEVIGSIARQADRTQPGVQMVRGRATNFDPERELAFAFLQIPESPVELTTGMAKISGNEAHTPRFEVRNRGDRPVRYLEIGWIIKDQHGREFLAASMPADVSVAPGRAGQVLEDAALRFSTPVESMSAFVSTVGFADGSYWIPARTSLNDVRIRKVISPSPEEQRLTQMIYLKKGLPGLIEELKKY